MPERFAPDRTNRAFLLTLGLGVFAGALDLNVLSPALPALARAFGIVTGDLAWTFTIYLLVTVAAIAIAGALADRYGRRIVYQASLGTFALGSALTIVAPTYGYFLLGRAILALGAGGLFPVATAAIGDVVPAQRRGAALGSVAAVWGIAAVAGPAVGGAIAHALSWQWIFAANIPLAAAVLGLTVRHMPQGAPRARGPIDGLGLLLLCCGLLAIVDAIVGLRADMGIVGALFLAGFALRERSTLDPLIPRSLLQNRQLMKAYALELVIGVLEGSLFFIPTVIVVAQGVSTAVAGAIAAVGAAAFVVVIPLSGRAIDRVGSRDVLFVGCLLTEIGLAIFAIGFGSTSLTLLAVLVAGMGFGALLGAPTRYIVTTEAAPSERATAVALLSQSLIVGQIVGTALIGSIIGNTRTELAGDRYAYLTVCAFALVALFLTATLHGRSQERGFRLGETAR